MNYSNNQHTREIHIMTTNDLPTLPIGTALRSSGFLDREVIRSAPGFALAVDGFDQISMAWVNGAWRARGNSAAWTVKPEPIEFEAKQTGPCVWKIRGGDHYLVTLLTVDEDLPGHMDSHAVAQAIAGLLAGMANEVQS
jgi:hypothetical protein